MQTYIDIKEPFYPQYSQQPYIYLKESCIPSTEAHTQKRPTCTPRSRSVPILTRNSLLVQMLARLAVGFVACYPAKIPPLAMLRRPVAFLTHVQINPFFCFGFCPSIPDNSGS